ncbi:MAG: hypothetical protein MUP17_05045 [candidate division Zixibacteria bacterium]|nr:hypothetical protein [candidate division Zixibacteria bacterium]
MGLLDKRASRWMEKRVKTNIHYQMHVFADRRFRCDFDMQVPSDWITTMANWFVKRQTSQENVSLDSFEVPEQLYGKVLKQFRLFIIEAQQKTAEKMPGFHLVTLRIQKFTYNKIPNKEEFFVEISISGDYLLA